MPAVYCFRQMFSRRCYLGALSRNGFVCFACINTWVYQLQVTVICMEFRGLRQTVIITGVFLSLSLFRPRAPAPSTAATYRYVHKHAWPQLTQHAGCTGTLTTTTAYGLLNSWYYRMSALVNKLEKKKWRKEQFGLPFAIMTEWLVCQKAKKKKKH